MTSHAIPLQEAAKTRFEQSTTSELKAYLTEMGEEFDDTLDQAKLRSKLLAAMGLTDAAGQMRRSTSAPVRPSSADPVRPPYNLTPNGLWGGRRIRVKIPRPEGTKIGRAEPLSWNGKATFWIPYDEVIALPYPLFEILRDRRRRIPMQQSIRQPDGTEEITTRWEFAEFSMMVYGDDPVTKDRAGSITEWYRNKGPGWFKKRNLRELQSICGLLEIPLQKNDSLRSSKSNEDLTADILIFLYGTPDVEDDSITSEREETETEA